MATIFISYRRADSASETGRLYDRLVERYGRAQVFKDVDSIPAGVDFPDYIAESIQASDVALVVIGPRWLGASSGFAQRRLDDAADFVRIEIETALRLGVPVIPVLVGGASLPSARRLPESLRSLLRQNGLGLRQDPDFSRDAERVFAAIDYWAAQPRRPLPPPAPPSAPPSAPPAVPTAAAERAAQPEAPGAMRASPARVAVASKPPTRPSSARRLPRPRLAALLIAVSALVVIAVSVALLLNGTAEAFFARRGQQPTQTTDLNATRTVAVVTETAQAKINTEVYRPAGGPGPCAPQDEQGSALRYWSSDFATCVGGTTAQFSNSHSITFAGRPYSSGNFPIAFEMDVTMTFASQGAGDCAILAWGYSQSSRPTQAELCRSGTWYDGSDLHALAATTPYHLKLTVTSKTISLRVNNETLLSNVSHTGQVSLLTFVATGDSSVLVDVSDFSLTPQ